MIDEPSVPSDADYIYSQNAQELKVEIRQGTSLIASRYVFSFYRGYDELRYDQDAIYDGAGTRAVSYGMAVYGKDETYGGRTFIENPHTILFTLTSTEQALITDWTTLQLWIYADADIAKMSLTSLSTPTVAGSVSFYIRASAVIG